MHQEEAHMDKRDVSTNGLVRWGRFSGPDRLLIWPGSNHQYVPDNGCASDAGFVCVCVMIEWRSDGFGGRVHYIFGRARVMSR